MSDPSNAPTHQAPDRLTGRVAVVTGASSGIGAATARALAAQGAGVVLAARREDRLDSLAREITGAGGKAVYAVIATTDAQSLNRMVAVAKTEYGHLDYAVNNAGAPGRGAFLDAPVELFDRAMDVNFRGVVLAMKAELPAMIDNGGGAIVNTASVGGLVGVPNLAPYVASKHAVVGLTKSVALEYAEQNIRVNAIAPGSTDTEMLASADDEHRAFLAGLAPMNRISDPTEIAAAIIYLLADATYSTGITLAADGGQSVP